MSWACFQLYALKLLSVVKELSLRVWAKDSRIALAVSVLGLEIAAPHRASFHLPLSFTETKSLLSFWALEQKHLLWERKHKELEIISVKVVSLIAL